MKVYEASFYGSLFEDPSDETSAGSRFFTSLAEARKWSRDLAEAAIAGMTEEEREAELAEEVNHKTMSGGEWYDHIDIDRIEVARMPLRQLAVHLLNGEKYVARRDRGVLKIVVKGLKIVEEKGGSS